MCIISMNVYNKTLLTSIAMAFLVSGFAAMNAVAIYRIARSILVAVGAATASAVFAEVVLVTSCKEG